MNTKKKKKKKRKAGIEQSDPKQDKLWETLGSGSFSFCYWGRISLVSVVQQKDLKRRTEALMIMQREVRIKESSPRERAPTRWK